MSTLDFGQLEQTGTLNLERVGCIDCMELSRNFQRVCVAGREFLFYSRRGNTVERWIAINRSIPKLRNTVAITNHRAEWRRGCTSKYANIIARGLCSFYAYEFSDVLPRIFHLSTMWSYTRIYDATEPICYSASIARRRYFVWNPKYEDGS